jgi:hypothetical protein
VRVPRENWEEIPLPSPADRFQPGSITITISEWQPADAVHRVAYAEGAIVLELGDNEVPVRAYQRGGAS